jgi:hypothetical protein
MEEEAANQSFTPKAKEQTIMKKIPNNESPSRTHIQSCVTISTHLPCSIHIQYYSTSTYISIDLQFHLCIEYPKKEKSSFFVNELSSLNNIIHKFIMRTITLLLSLQLLSAAVTTTWSFVVVTPSTIRSSSSLLHQSAVIEDDTSTTQESTVPVDKIRYVIEYM